MIQDVQFGSTLHQPFFFLPPSCFKHKNHGYVKKVESALLEEPFKKC